VKRQTLRPPGKEMLKTVLGKFNTEKLRRLCHVREDDLTHKRGNGSKRKFKGRWERHITEHPNAWEEGGGNEISGGKKRTEGELLGKGHTRDRRLKKGNSGNLH